MPAETAATATGVTAAPEPNEVGSPATAGKLTEESDSRVDAILQDAGISEDVRESVHSTSGKGNESDGNKKDGKENLDAQADEGSEGAGGDSASAEAGAGESAKGEGDEGKEEVGTPRQSGAATAEEDPISDEEKAAWAPEALARIHKLTAKRETLKGELAAAQQTVQAAEAERDELREQLAGVRPVQLAPTAQNPLSDVQDQDTLAHIAQGNKELRRWAMMHKDGATDVPQVDPKTGQQMLDAQGNPRTRDYSAEEIADIQFQAEEKLEAVPVRAAFLQAREAHEAHARTSYPEQFKKGTQDNQLLQEVFRMMPDLLRHPDATLAAGDYLRGFKERTAEEAAAAKAAARNGNGANGAPKKEPSKEVKPFLKKQPPISPNVPTTRGGGSDRSGGNTTGGNADVDKARERMTQGGGEEAETDYIGALRNSQREPGKRAALV